MSDLADLGRNTLIDLAQLICGRRLGSGIGRTVYRMATEPDKVIKIEEGGCSFQNVIEWQTWEALRYTKHARWLAPVEHISPCGIVLIMAATEPLPKARYPERMPTWLSDFKVDNYGLYKGRVVCHDYGTNLLLNHGAFGGRMRKVDWS